ncbi:MAG TPA: metal-dependent hydrolase [Chitinophagaceae bacterium]|nr:metal-dependent hydrolase [Chitinophagaceae bacterium]
MKLNYFGHSCFSLEIAGHTVLFDPFITPNEQAGAIRLEEIKADYIFVSHGHADHIADCITLAGQTGALVVAAFEVTEWLKGKGVEKVHPLNTGGKKSFPFGTVKCTVAHHSSGLPDGSYGGNPMGFLLTSDEGNVYYSGDTALTLDMQLVPRWAPVHWAILPIGDNFTMGYDDAVEAARLVGCRKVIGVHYDTFGYIQIDHDQAQKAFADASMELFLPAIGTGMEL